MKLYCPDSRVTVRHNFFSVRVVHLWNKSSEEVVSASSVSAFISRLNSMHVSFRFFNVFLLLCVSSFTYLYFRAAVCAL